MSTWRPQEAADLRQRFRARGEDLREMPIVERKARLKKLIREQRWKQARDLIRRY